tara:strand:- start:365 stop:520 length:156 start_codon:yes stop_codon:yes gene_type:complete
MVADYRILAINLSTFIFSMTDADVVLKILLLVVTIGYTLHKWYLLHKNKNG